MKAVVEVAKPDSRYDTCTFDAQRTQSHVRRDAGGMLSIFSFCLALFTLTKGDSRIIFTTPVSPLATESLPTRLRADSVPCTAREKVCFEHDRVLFQPTNKCYRLLTQGPCKVDEIFVVLKKSYNEKDQVVGACRLYRPCDNENRIRMADGMCYDVERPYPDAPVTFCPFNKHLYAETNIFGEGSCCSEPHCWSTYVFNLSQPTIKGRCFAVNLATYQQWGTYPKIPLQINHVKCTKRQSRCFSRNKVIYSRDGRCYDLLKPCGEGRWVIVNKTHLLTSQELDIMCVQQRCSPGQVFMSSDWTCRSLWELQSTLCAGDDVLFDIFGEAHCVRGITQDEMIALPEESTEEGMCVISLPPLLGYGGSISSSPAPGSGDMKSRCDEANRDMCDPESEFHLGESTDNDNITKIEYSK